MNDFCPKISIVVPVYNDSEYLVDCLNSIHNQTFTELEAIIVNDASSDNSENIIKEYISLDSRFSYFGFESNQSAFLARKKGIELSRGNIVMFVDGDDYLSLDACQKAYDKFSEKHVDILHFSTNIIADNLSSKRKNQYKKLIDPSDIYLENSKIFTHFINSNFEGHLWNKAFDRDLLIKALDSACNRILPKAQDKYLYWICAFFANSYIGWPNESLYNYRYGAGVENSDTMSLDMFEVFCKQSWVEDEISIFMNNYSNVDYSKEIKKSRNNLIAHCVNQWSKLSNENASEGMNMLLDYWTGMEDCGEIVGNLCRIYNDNRQVLIDRVKPYFTSIKDSIVPKTIGTYYPKLGNGGIQRVMQKLVELWINMGYKVVAFVDYESEDDYELPPSVEKVVLKYPGNTCGEKYFPRGRELDRKIREYNIDVMVYHAYLGNSLIWDMLVSRMVGSSFVVYYHNSFIKYLLSNDARFYTIPNAVSLASSMCVLSRVDRVFFSSFCKKVYLVNNPVTYPDENISDDYLKDPIIVWVGRLDAFHKQFSDTVDIMKEVLKVRNDAKLFIVGKDDDGKNFNRLKKRIEKLKLEDSIVLCGYQKNVAPFYRIASVFLMTSSHEGSPMALSEALNFGLPVVMYDLSYLELVRGNDGIITVPQHDVKCAAENIIELLDDYKYRREIGIRGKIFSDNYFHSLDIRKIWIDIFEGKASVHTESEIDDVSILCNTIVDGFKLNLKNQIHKENEVNKKISELEKRSNNLIVTSKNEDYSVLKNNLDYANYCLGEIRKSKSYKIGLFITWIPRHIIQFVKRGNR